MITKNLDDALDTILMLLSAHCRRRRLSDLQLGRLTSDQRRAVITATLDFLEREVERRHAQNLGHASSHESDAATEPAQRHIQHLLS